MRAKPWALGAGVVVASKFFWRERTVDWDKVSNRVVHSEFSQFVDVEGIRVHFQEFGPAGGSVLLLLHGYTSSSYVWKTVGPMLADQGFRVIAVDLVGFGYSGKPAWFEYTINAQARMLSRFMDRVGIGLATVVGNSYGGAVALTLVLDYAERVERLVLVDAVFNDEPKNHPLLKLAELAGVVETLTPFLIDSKAFWKNGMYGSFAPANAHLITDERVESSRRPLYARDGHNAVLKTSRNWSAERIDRDLGLITHPTLIIWGEDDYVIPIKQGLRLYDAIAHSRFIVLKNAGHVPMEEQSEVFTTLVSEFCCGREASQ